NGRDEPSRKEAIQVPDARQSLAASRSQAEPGNEDSDLNLEISVFRHMLGFSVLATMSGVVFAVADAKAPEKLTPAVVNQIWIDFGRHDDDGCFQALVDMERLKQAPDLVVPFLSERLKPAATADLSGVAKLIADLDSNDF